MAAENGGGSATKDTAACSIETGVAAGAAVAGASCRTAVSSGYVAIVLTTAGGAGVACTMRVSTTGRGGHFDVSLVGTPCRIHVPQPPPREGGIAGVVHLPTGPTRGAVAVSPPVGRIGIGDQMRLIRG